MKKAYFGEFGGQFVPESMKFALDELEHGFEYWVKTPCFRSDWKRLMRDYVGRPTPLFFAERLSDKWGGCRVYLKREDLNHTGAHKINNCLGQALLARLLGKSRIVAETGAGQHGVAAATVCALLKMECTVYMGAVDIRRQAVNVDRMKLLGAEVRPVRSGSQTLKDAVNQALRDWVTSIDTTHYLLGSAVGPHPYPRMVKEFQSVIGRESRHQILKMTGRLPDAVVACVGGGSNAIGIFAPFIKDREVRLFGVEAAGENLMGARHAAGLARGNPGILHGSFSYLLQDDDGQILPTHSISAGLDYPGVGPEHSRLKQTRRVSYSSATDMEAVSAFEELAVLEGIIPALESSHALAFASKLSRDLGSDGILIVNLSGRGDKDLASVRRFRAAGRENVDE